MITKVYASTEAFVLQIITLIVRLVMSWYDETHGRRRDGRNNAVKPEEPRDAG